MPSEREKMLAGELYDPLDPELVSARARARDLCQDLNATREADTVERRRLGHEHRLRSVGILLDDVSWLPQLLDLDQARLEARSSLVLLHVDLLPGFRSELSVARNDATQPLVDPLTPAFQE